MYIARPLHVFIDDLVVLLLLSLSVILSVCLDPSHLFVNLLLHEMVRTVSHFQHIFSRLLSYYCKQCSGTHLIEQEQEQERA